MRPSVRFCIRDEVAAGIERTGLPTRWRGRPRMGCGEPTGVGSRRTLSFRVLVIYMVEGADVGVRWPSIGTHRRTCALDLMRRRAMTVT